MPYRRPSFQTILVFAVFIGLVAVLGALKALQVTGLGTRVATRRIVVAVRDIAEGAVIDRHAVTTTDWPAATVPVGAFTTIDSVVGRITRVPVFNSDALVPARLAPVGSRPGLEAKISAGKRAMGVLIDDVAGITGVIQPNSRVDVLVTLRAVSQRQVAKVFMENVRVLSIDWHEEREGTKDPIDATIATLEVTPGEAERLAVAMNQGSIQLVLRGYGDRAKVSTSSASSTDVLAELRNARAVRLPTADTKAGPRRTPLRAAPVTSAAPDTAAAEPALAVAQPQSMTLARPESTVVRTGRGNDLVIKKFERVDSAGAVRTP
jgi:pilus assembly protein CpaB